MDVVGHRRLRAFVDVDLEEMRVRVFDRHLVEERCDVLARYTPIKFKGIVKSRSVLLMKIILCVY